MQLLEVLILISFVWLIILTGLGIYIFVHFRRLSKGVSTGNLISVIDNLIDIEQENSKSIGSINEEIDDIHKKSLLHIQKFGLIKFNPFQELGGDHSFSLALLDGNDNGIILTGLHSRERTRIYSKNIEKGKSKIELSKEETKAINKALK